MIRVSVSGLINLWCFCCCVFGDFDFIFWNICYFEICGFKLMYEKFLFYILFFVLVEGLMVEMFYEIVGVGLS